MEYEIQDSGPWKKFARALLATTCLTVASGKASATTVTEGTSPAPADFPNTSPGYLLPGGTDVINGSLTGTTDTKDWFEFQSLAGGTAFSLHGVYTPLHQERGVTFQVFDSLGQQFGSSSLEGQGRPINGTVPGDGDIFVQVQFAQAGNPQYQFTMSATVTPEPAPLSETILGVGLVGALAWRRKRALQS